MNVIPLKERRGFPVATDLVGHAVAAGGTIVLGTIVEGDTITIGDGITSIVFEFDSNQTLSAPTNTPVVFIAPPPNAPAPRGVVQPQMIPGGSGAAAAPALAAAINASVLRMTADLASATLTLTNAIPGAAGNVAITTAASPGSSITVTGMAGGLDLVDLRTLQSAVDNVHIDIGSAEINIGDLEANIGAKADVAASADSGSFSLIALTKRALEGLTTLLARIPAIGRKDSAGSMSVVLSSDHANVPVAGSVSIGSITAGDTNIGNVDIVTMPAITGAVTASIAPATWTDFYVAYTAGDAPGDHTVIAAPAAGHALRFIEVVVVSGGAAANTIIIKKGSAAVKAVPCAAVLDGIYLNYEYPDYHTFPEATALVCNNTLGAVWYVYGRYCTITL